MSDLTLEQAQKLIQEYKSIIRLLENKTAEFKQILEKENKNSKELDNLLDKIQKTKEEFENSSFSVLQKNNELFSKSDTILQNIQKLSNMLLQLEDKIEKEKITFDKEIKQKFNNLQDFLKSSIDIIYSKISTEKTKIEKEFKNFKETTEYIKIELLQENEKLNKTFSNTKNKVSTIIEDFNSFIEDKKNKLNVIEKDYKSNLDKLNKEIKKKIKEMGTAILIETFVSMIFWIIISFIGGIFAMGWFVKHTIVKNQTIKMFRIGKEKIVIIPSTYKIQNTKKIKNKKIP